jgi:hypothetical protein
MAQHEQLLAERLLGRPGAGDQGGVARRGQITRAIDTALGGLVAAPSEQQ